MRRLVQTNLDPGNCWQTAIACILEIDPESMPSQNLYDVEHRSGWFNYTNILQGYLGKHFGLGYAELYEFQFRGVEVVSCGGYHILIGPTVRSEANRKAGKLRVDHVVVGRWGIPLWDVHPSGAGLIRIERWGVLAPVTERFLQERSDRAKAMAEEGKCDAEEFRRVFIDCVCPACERGREAAT